MPSRKLRAPLKRSASSGAMKPIRAILGGVFVPAGVAPGFWGGAVGESHPLRRLTASQAKAMKRARRRNGSALDFTRGLLSLVVRLSDVAPLSRVSATHSVG